MTTAITYRSAVATLAKYFQALPEIFLKLPKPVALEWGEQIGPKYQLTNDQHRFLVGERVTWVKHAGLMRCCTRMLGELLEWSLLEQTEGKTVECKYCKASMIFHDGAWQWNNPK